MNDQEAWNDAMESLIEFEKEMQEHNSLILYIIGDEDNDFESLMDYCRITDKMEWVEKPTFKAEQNPDVYGIFTLTHVDQWSTGDSGDSFAGFMYVKVKGFNEWLKIPYDC
jgi:hypothetical protein